MSYPHKDSGDTYITYDNRFSRKQIYDVTIIMAICKECGINIYWCSVEDDMAALIPYGSLTIMNINLWWELLSGYSQEANIQNY